MKIIVICVIFSTILHQCENYRILGLFPLQSKSHMAMFESLMKGLAERGHEVDVLSHFPQKKQIPRYNDISVRGTLPIFVNNISVSFGREQFGTYYNMLNYLLFEGPEQICTAVLNSSAVQELKHTKKKYDLVIMEICLTDCMVGFAYHFKLPVIGVTSSVDLPWGGARIGNPDNPSYIPNYLVPYLSQMSLWERLINTALLMVMKLGYSRTPAYLWITTDNDELMQPLYNKLQPPTKNNGCKCQGPKYEVSHPYTDAITRENFSPDLPSIKELIRNTSLILVNSHFSINYARPTVPNFIEVGGLHIQPPKALSQNFQDAISITSQYKGIIYLSTGSMILTETLPSDKLRALFEAFRELPYKILWKAVRENMPKDVDIPSNIHFEPWMPQIDILCHPNVKLFVTHGGLMGTQEGIFCGLPRLGIPFFADQSLNLKASEAMGVAIMVEYDDITKSSILTATKALLEDPKYKQNAERLSKLFRDRPLSAMDTAIYWIEYVIKHNGAPHLRTIGADLPWYQYYLVDVGAIFLFSLLMVLALIYYLSTCIFRTAFNRSKHPKKIKKN